MERNSNQSSNGFMQKQNKGFTVHLGDEYVGHFVINEDRVSPATVKNLQKPENIKAVLAQAEFRKFIPKEERENRDTSGLDAIMAGVDETDDSGSSSESQADEQAGAEG